MLLLLLLLTVLRLWSWVACTILGMLLRRLIRLTIVTCLSNWLLYVIYFWIVCIQHCMRCLSSSRVLLHLLMILSLHAPVIESIYPCVSSTLNASGNCCHSFRVLLIHYSFLSIFVCLVELVINWDILVNIDETSTWCRVFLSADCSLWLWPCAIITISYVYLFIFFYFIDFLWRVILHFLAIYLVILSWFYFFVHSFSVIIVIFLIESSLLRLNHIFLWLS